MKWLHAVPWALKVTVGHFAKMKVCGGGGASAGFTIERMAKPFMREE